jgi:biotin carboxyl carrier protein
MRYLVRLDPAREGKPVVVDVEELPSGGLLVYVDGRKAGVDVAVLGDRFSVLVDRRVVDLTLEGSPPDLDAIASGRRLRVRVESERGRAIEAAGTARRTSREKRAVSPMSGRVVKVLVQKGDSVLAGQPLVVMEAMKMENEIRADAAGTVTEVHVAPGAAVAVHAKLVTLA